jgi:hypothetical protein
MNSLPNEHKTVAATTAMDASHLTTLGFTALAALAGGILIGKCKTLHTHILFLLMLF